MTPCTTHVYAVFENPDQEDAVIRPLIERRVHLWDGNPHGYVISFDHDRIVPARSLPGFRGYHDGGGR